MRRQRALVTEAGRRFDGIAQRFPRTGKLSNGASASAVAALGSDLEIYFLCELVDGRETAFVDFIRLGASAKGHFPQSALRQSGGYISRYLMGIAFWTWTSDN